MTGRENMRRTIEFASPAYIPNILSVDFSFIRDQNTADTEQVKALLDRLPRDVCSMGVWINQQESRGSVTRKHDEWGTDWIDDGHGMVTCGYPLADGFELPDGYSFPAPSRPDRFRKADALLATDPPQYRLGTVWFTLFERLWMLRGIENLLTDPYLFPDAFMQLKSRVVEINLALIDLWCRRDIDGVYFSDDWGGQSSLLISPADFRRYYADDYRRMFRKVRDAGKHVWLHSCGNVTDLIPDFIDLGVNVLNPVQPQAMDIRRLARDFGGRICFNGGLDVQQTLIRGPSEAIRQELQTLIDLFGRYAGGYIVNTSHSIMPETPLCHVAALLQAYLDMSGYAEI
jgi:uroporphyrinogen decarboxylase